jgi:hypothetical protein
MGLEKVQSAIFDLDFGVKNPLIWQGIRPKAIAVSKPVPLLYGIPTPCEEAPVSQKPTEVARPVSYFLMYETCLPGVLS